MSVSQSEVNAAIDAMSADEIHAAACALCAGLTWGQFIDLFYPIYGMPGFMTLTFNGPEHAPEPVNAKNFDEWIAETSALLEECAERRK